MNLSTILIVDDELHMLRFIAYALRPINATLLTASSGREALQIIRERPIDLALFDVHMQDIDGLTALQELRANGTLPGLPVIMITGAGESHIEAQGRALGVQAFFRKPFSPAQLACCVRELLQAAHGPSACVNDNPRV
jgi:DNA-binding response OmpR family regulator